MKMRVSAWILCVLMLVGVLASCKEDASVNLPQNTETTAADSQAEPEETRELTNAEKRQMIPGRVKEGLQGTHPFPECKVEITGIAVYIFSEFHDRFPHSAPQHIISRP